MMPQCWSCSWPGPVLVAPLPLLSQPLLLFSTQQQNPSGSGGAVLPDPWGLFTFSITPNTLHPTSTPSHYGTSIVLAGSKQNGSEMFETLLHSYTKLKERAHLGDKSPLFVKNLFQGFFFSWCRIMPHSSYFFIEWNTTFFSGAGRKNYQSNNLFWRVLWFVLRTMALWKAWGPRHIKDEGYWCQVFTVPQWELLQL